MPERPFRKSAVTLSPQNTPTAMDLMTRTLAGLVTETAIPAFGPYSTSVISLDSALHLLVVLSSVLRRSLHRARH
ncbi:hypothetical protein DEU38_12364 [Rhodococcus sp. AG1013]|nr:hypothetical protein DEU38_12364 [Rhodococcus sp. AG1013]